METPKNESVPQLGYESRLDRDDLNSEQEKARTEYLKSQENKMKAVGSQEEGFVSSVARKNEVNFFVKAGATPYIMGTYKYSMNLYDGNWRNSINNSALVNVVAKDLKMQDTLRLTGELIPPNEVADELVIEDMPIAPYTPQTQEPELELIEDISKEKLNTEQGSVSIDGPQTKAEQINGEKKDTKENTISKSNLPNENFDENIMAQQAAFDTQPIKKEVKEVNEDLKNKALKETDAIIAQQQARFRERDGKNIGVEGNINSHDTDLGKMEQDVQIASPEALVIKETPVKKVVTPEDFPKEWALVPKEGEVNADGSLEYTKYTSEQYEAISQEYTKNIIESNARVKKIEAVLENRKQSSLEKLKSFGLKTLDGYRNMKPRNKLLLGVLFAGASVATGGATSILTKMLAAGSYGRGFYEKILKAEEEKGNEVNKKWLAVRSALYGTVMAVGTTMLFAEIASHVHIDTEGLKESATEKLSEMKEGLKNLFGFSSDVASSVPDVSTAGYISMANSLNPGESIVPVGPESIPVVADVPVTPDVPTPDAIVPEIPVDDVSSYNMDTTNPTVPEASVPEYVTPEVPLYVPSEISFGQMDYTIKPGDTFQNIFDRITPHIPGAESLTKEQLAGVAKELHDSYLSSMGNASSIQGIISNIDAGKVNEVIRVDQLGSAIKASVARITS